MELVNLGCDELTQETLPSKFRYNLGRLSCHISFFPTIIKVEHACFGDELHGLFLGSVDSTSMIIGGRVKTMFVKSLQLHVQTISWKGLVISLPLRILAHLVR